MCPETGKGWYAVPGIMAPPVDLAGDMAAIVAIITAVTGAITVMEVLAITLHTWDGVYIPGHGSSPGLLALAGPIIPATTLPITLTATMIKPIQRVLWI